MYYFINTNNITVTHLSCQKRRGASADKLQVRAARIIPFVGFAKPKQNSITGGHGAQYICRLPPAGASERLSAAHHCQ